MTPNNRAILAAIGTVATLALASPARATLSRAIPFDEKVETAQAIVLGKCLSTRSEWDPQHRFIVTYSTFQIEKSIKGQASGEVTLITPGGTVGDVHQAATGVPAFTPGEEHVLFVKSTPAGPTVAYFDQGTYDVTTDSRGEKSIVPIATEAVHVDTQRGVAVPSESARTLNQFERDVRSSADRQRANQMKMIEGRRQQPSLVATLLEYKALIALALAGIALATWQLLKR